MTLEHRDFEIKASDVDEQGQISGYASYFGVQDQGGDSVVPGAFKRSLKRTPVKMLWQHDPREPIGKWQLIEEDEKGLRVGGAINLDVPRGKAAYSLLKQGAMDGLSIGYRTIKAENSGNGRSLIELELHEISIVTFPMLAEATVDAVKDAMALVDEGDTSGLKRIVETAMRDAGFSARKAKALAAVAPKIVCEGSRDATPQAKAKLLRESFANL